MQTLEYAPPPSPPSDKQVTFMNLATLPASIREAVHFTCMTHVCNAILEHITGADVSANESPNMMMMMTFFVLFRFKNSTIIIVVPR